MTESIKEALEIIYYNLGELPETAQKLLNFGAEEKVWLFEGDMAAGKTTLIKALCREKRVTDNVTSPTFSLVNEYSTLDGETIYHFDFYRIKDELEAMDIGIEEYLYSGNLCLIEWPSKIESLLPGNFLQIHISVEPEHRKIQARHYES
ncbi:MAG: tRNA (adenosine(37)-N6)-threonylcarbamoyltransferase complex ATPase subunit type 1 TsaE [Cytophagaceae bacterium]